MSERIGNLYFTDNGDMIDLDAVALATWGNRDNDVVFVRVHGDVSEYGTMIRPGGGDFLAALHEWRTRERAAAQQPSRGDDSARARGGAG